MAKKKDKTKVITRCQQAKQQKVRKRKLRLIKGRGGESPGSLIVARHGLSDLGAPTGFCSVSFSQAMIEYAAPLMEQIKGEKAMNVAMQFSGLFWNYALSVQEV